MQYVKDPHSGKVYTEDVLTVTNAVDPAHWDTDIQNLQNKAKDLQSQIDDINNVQIPAKQAEKEDFFKQFPELVVNN